MRKLVPDLPDGDLPCALTRAYEEELLRLCASRSLDATRWKQTGPLFFMAGIAVMLASTSDFDRRSYLALAEQIHPGASGVEVFARWLQVTPLRPSRFLPMLKVLVQRTAG